MNPRVVVVIDMNGVKMVRLVASDEAEEEVCLSLYLAIREKLRSIDEVLKHTDH